MCSVRNLGARRLKIELMRLQERSLIHKVLSLHKVEPIKKFRRKVDYILYERSLLGDRVQLDT